ncbi:hypothetical protein J2S00_001811 [Caldalkalibacillus uzonensis]|uniref:Uncharacterized protein n=1 Tax=Caldalkalibacillus uzonensis TaxID=353224 RepID=A0ABU0CRH6_9BACI|nr:hypothetical protein [Caldalkalibacillus uzonensis]MDQ0339025.1 hypothetical protein [Caldalkalibacillus uzonensis]
MAVVGLCSVTVQVTAIDGVVLPDPITVFANTLFPKFNGIVTVTVFGQTVQFPCPSVDLEEEIDVPGVGTVTLLINAVQLG